MAASLPIDDGQGRRGVTQDKSNGRKDSGTGGCNGAGSGAGSGGGEYLRELAVSLIPSINVSWGGESSVYPEQILACSALEQHRAQ
ncbi:hypothetical protein HZH68_007571 [Vespula germanica]|uniref:Uncharacterized protein n=2 Tax=Vespula TaxID=7451 RepID=A0A834K7V9_VESGE|nr:hypothetical protein HZH66_006823 [Vespula vulgaris]KAF7401751.1 hypothetical protein HZH68_007571 [Vespula germanica]